MTINYRSLCSDLRGLLIKVREELYASISDKGKETLNNAIKRCEEALIEPTDATPDAQKTGTYIILRDTFGDGLEVIPGVDLEVIDEADLSKWVFDAASIILSEEGYTYLQEYEKYHLKIGEEIVVCQIVDKIQGVLATKWIRDQIADQEEAERKEQYELYLKLKKRFDGNC